MVFKSNDENLKTNKWQRPKTGEKELLFSQFSTFFLLFVFLVVPSVMPFECVFFFVFSFHFFILFLLLLHIIFFLGDFLVWKTQSIYHRYKYNMYIQTKMMNHIILNRYEWVSFRVEVKYICFFIFFCSFPFRLLYVSLLVDLHMFLFFFFALWMNRMNDRRKKNICYNFLPCPFHFVFRRFEYFFLLRWVVVVVVGWSVVYFFLFEIQSPEAMQKIVRCTMYIFIWIYISIPYYTDWLGNFHETLKSIIRLFKHDVHDPWCIVHVLCTKYIHWNNFMPFFFSFTPFMALYNAHVLPWLPILLSMLQMNSKI